LETNIDISGIILSGGKSVRMGENKAFIEIDGVPIIYRIYSLFKELFQEIIIVTNQKE
jgi:molybdopterin-guanine dinucleotide biosynthesis protein A